MFVIALVAPLLGCKDGDSAVERAAPVSSGSAGVGAPAAPSAAGSAQAPDANAVPAFSAAPASAAACAPKDRARLDRLRRGEDDTVTAGSANVEQLTAEIFGDCATGRADLARALNEGGLQHHRAKRYTEASRWWTAALRADPAHVLARYNLACALALSGKAEPALSALSEVSRAAAAGNARATQQLQKARTDPDLQSLRALPRFAEIVATGATAGGDSASPDASAPALPFGFDERDFTAFLKAAGLERKNGVVLNVCGMDGEPSFDTLYLGPALNPAFLVIVEGADGGAGMPCYGQAGGSASLLRRLPATKPDDPAAFEVVLAVTAAAVREGKSRHLNTTDLILGGGGGFCEGHFRWNGKKYEHYKNEGQFCPPPDDEDDNGAPQPGAGSSTPDKAKAAASTGAAEPKLKAKGEAGKAKKGEAKPTEKPASKKKKSG